MQQKTLSRTQYRHKRNTEEAAPSIVLVRQSSVKKMCRRGVFDMSRRRFVRGIMYRLEWRGLVLRKGQVRLGMPEERLVVLGVLRRKTRWRLPDQVWQIALSCLSASIIQTGDNITNLDVIHFRSKCNPNDWRNYFLQQTAQLPCRVHLRPES
jgi:hypothetical protein